MCLLSAEAINEELKCIAGKYPDIAKLQLEGCSVEERDIYSLVIGNGSRTLICTGGVHAREIINPTVLVKMAKDYCEKCTKYNAAISENEQIQSTENWNDNGKAVNLLQNYSILILPLLNPDGYEMACQLPDKADWKYNALGIDINRDFPCCSYRRQESSKEPLSAVESQILVNIFKREDSIGYLDFHSRGREIYWYRAALDEEYNKRQKNIAEALCNLCGYRLGTKEDELKDSLSGGNTVQYYSENFHLPALTVETVAEEVQFPLAHEWMENTYDEIKEIPLRYLDIWDKG